jgi:predicted metalloprotease with PDZ domain
MLSPRTSVLSVVFLALLAGCGEGLSQAIDPIVYEISFENRAHHEAHITVHLPSVPDGTLELRMSRSSPGRYALHEFAKNVYGVEVTGAAGSTVHVTRPDPHQWDVEGHGGEVTVRYTLYGDHADGTYTAIDRTHAHLNMPATFLWARGLEDRPIELRVDVPEGSGWRVATQLAPTDAPDRFTAPDLAYFLDSPTEVSDHWLRSWEVDGKTIRIALHHEGSEGDAERYGEAVAAIVEASRDLYGTLPDFDFGTYTFLACYLPWADGDGMEHRNSTVLTSTGSLAANMTALLGTVAHEFFHAWNVERIRPRTLEPFDFERANMSRELWFAEGFTSYFDDLILWRAGLITDAAFAQRMGAIANAVTNARGRAYFSPIEMSMRAPFVDAATSVDPTNGLNTFLSYYTWGSGIGMALDLELRTRFEGVTADHLMREMWATYGATERPYSVDDIEAALARVSGDAAFAADFFSRYVRGRQAPPFEQLLGAAGIEVAPANPGAAWLGSAAMTFSDGGAVLTGTPREETAWYEAGLDRGDRIVSIDGRQPSDRAGLGSIVAGFSPGATVEIRYHSRGEERVATVGVGEDPTLVGRWTPNDRVTPDQFRLRAAWITPPGG